MSNIHERLETLGLTAEGLKGTIENIEKGLGKEPKPWEDITSKIQNDPTTDPFHSISSKANEITILIQNINSRISLLPSRSDNSEVKNP